MIWFGPAGSSESFSAMGYKAVWQAPEYLEKMGLNAYEYQCGRGVRVNADNAVRLKAAAREKGIRLSLHAPYYISLSSVETEKRQASIRYILESAAAARMIGADRVVVHSGSCAKISREKALELAKETLKTALDEMDAAGYGEIILCPETMGKHNQLGTLDEVLALCGIDERLIPCVDFGHLNARTLGGVNSEQAFEEVIATMERALGTVRARKFHAHFSKIEYTENGGEKRHLTFADTVYGPHFGPLAGVLLRHGCEPVVICESAGTQAEDAAAMKTMYEAVRASGNGGRTND